MSRRIQKIFSIRVDMSETKVHVVFFRHGSKTHGNTDTVAAGVPVFDAGLTRDGVEEIERSVTRVMNATGPPRMILSSAFRRCRDSASIAGHHTMRFIFFDHRIREFLGHHSKKRPSDCVTKVDPTTLTLLRRKNVPGLGDLRVPEHPDTQETIEQFEERIANFIEAIKSSKMTSVWVFTHGFLIETAYKLIRSTTMPDEMKPAGVWAVDL